MLRKVFRAVQFILEHGIKNFIFDLSNKKLFNVENKREKINQTSFTDSDKLAQYPWLCELASTDDRIFKKFRRSHILVEVLDHVSLKLGKEYVTEILKYGPFTNEYIKVLNKIDNIGNPRRYYFKPFGTFSPTLLRYLKVYLDLEFYFGSLQKFKIVEIGVGFGGQASLIGLQDKPKNYWCFDIPPVLMLAEKVVDKLKVPGTYEFFDGRKPVEKISDLVISNYAFSELTRDVQEIYLQNIILKSPRGYITWNNISEHEFAGYSLAELVRLLPGSQIIPERPYTGSGNAIIIWGHKL
jgi:putative sugar O-methyltransferase